jgi:hypothetical protein
MKAQKLFAILTLALIVAAGVIATFLPVTISIGRTAIAFCIILGIAFASGAIAFVIRTRQADAENHRYRVWLMMDITERVEAEERERTLERQLRESSHRAGMTVIATGVLNNVGNVLNSLGIANTTARRELQSLRLDRLQQASAMINSNRATLATYMSEDARGRHFPELLSAISAQLAVNAQAVETELHTIDQLLDHLRSIVSAQQSLAQLGGLREPIRLGVQASGTS